MHISCTDKIFSYVLSNIYDFNLIEIQNYRKFCLQLKIDDFDSAKASLSLIILEGAGQIEPSDAKFSARVLTKITLL